jgi:hypothetical protein
MKNYPNIFLYVSIVIFSCYGPPKNNAFIDVQNGKLPGTSLLALYIPLDKISLSMVQDKDLATLIKSNPLYLFVKKKPVISQASSDNDSFYIEMANALALYEISQHYKVFQHKADTNDSMLKDQISILLPTRWSPLANDTGSFEKISSFTKQTAEKYAVDLIIIPYECSLKETETQTKGWRDNKYGKYYEKPSTVDAKALFHVQIWDKNGHLQYERKGTGSSKRPILYDALKQKQPVNQGPIDYAYAKNIFAPTLVRALGVACRNAFAGK